ncbi:MAG TPA: hypothetical protein VM889_03700 [Candidatus Thermoplasmatota archaeon]|nr:hypothetical protein [Candidatus Thermoplasmatota archaeon]
MAKRPWYAVPRWVPLVCGLLAAPLLALGFAGGWERAAFATASFATGAGFGLAVATALLLILGRDAPRPAKGTPESAKEMSPP